MISETYETLKLSDRIQNNIYRKANHKTKAFIRTIILDIIFSIISFIIGVYEQTPYIVILTPFISLVLSAIISAFLIHKDCILREEDRIKRRILKHKMHSSIHNKFVPLLNDNVIDSFYAFNLLISILLCSFFCIYIPLTKCYLDSPNAISLASCIVLPGLNFFDPANPFHFVKNVYYSCKDNRDTKVSNLFSFIFLIVLYLYYWYSTLSCLQVLIEIF